MASAWDLVNGGRYALLSEELRLACERAQKACDRLAATCDETRRLAAAMHRRRLSSAPERAAGSPLTSRQLEILAYLADGASTEEIAVRCWLAPVTVRNHVRNILRNLGARSRLEAVAVARRRGLL